MSSKLKKFDISEYEDLINNLALDPELEEKDIKELAFFIIKNAGCLNDKEIASQNELHYQES